MRTTSIHDGQEGFVDGSAPINKLQFCICLVFASLLPPVLFHLKCVYCYSRLTCQKMPIEQCRFFTMFPMLIRITMVEFFMIPRDRVCAAPVLCMLS